MTLVEVRKVTYDRLTRKLNGYIRKFETIDEVISYALDSIEVLDKAMDNSYAMSIIGEAFDSQKVDRIVELEEELESLKAGSEAQQDSQDHPEFTISL